MENFDYPGLESSFSPEEIGQQLERICAATQFAESDILKRFLTFIVQETLQGRSNCLKEYTIALQVLQKSVHFNPQQNGIVRIHAGRLRRALNAYYEGKGINEPFVITIPKGKYVPFFSRRSCEPAKQVSSFASVPDVFIDENLSLAVFPLICPANDEGVKFFAENLCMEMSAALSHFGQVSVIAYQAAKNFAERHQDIKELGNAVGFSHVLTGVAQFVKDKMRVCVQLIECSSYKQLWCETFERKLNKSNQFEIQDEICHSAIDRISELNRNWHKSLHLVPVASAV